MSDQHFEYFGFVPRRQLEILLASEEREGLIDGVRFDLRHPSVPAELWHAPDGAYGIEMLFPSERDEEEEPSEHLFEDARRWVQAEVGDTVSIANLRRFDRHEGPLADLHDTEEWWADLRLTRPTGERIQLEGVMCFVPRDALGPHSPHFPPDDDGYAAYVEQHGITFEKIGRRVKRLAASTKRRGPAMWATVNGMRARVSDALLPLLPPETEVEHGWIYEAPFGAAREWLTVADRALSLAKDEVAGFEDEGACADLSVLLDTVAAAAYALARAECELRVAPLAKNTLKVIEGGTLGGKRSAQNRREWVSRHWEPHALELGKALREKDPSLGQANLAAEILFAWTSDVPPPGHDWTLNFVRAAERQKLIQRRVPNGGRKGVGRTI